MPRYEDVSTIVRADGVLSGEPRVPINIAAHRKGGIHDDETAKALGFEGGLVSGLIRNEQFPPLALAAFGPRWFERGFYSFYYRTPTLHLEPVRAFMRDPGERTDDIQVEAWSETEDGRCVADGTIGIGEVAEPTPLRRRLEESPPSGELHILRAAKAGQSLGEVVRRFPLAPPEGGRDGQLIRRDTITEPVAWYFGPSPWGGPIAGSYGLYRLMRPSLAPIGIDAGTTLDGGIEVRFVDGPVFLDREYVLSGRVVAVGQSRKTEDLWMESSLRDPESGGVVAELLLMARWMKSSSPLYGAV